MKRHAVLLAALLTALILLLSGCGAKDESEEAAEAKTEQPAINNTTQPETVTAPTLAMTLPGSLTGTVAKPSLIKAQEPNCNYGGMTENPFENAYSMTKYLVGISQSYSCFGDFIISAIAQGAGEYIGDGKITIGDGSGGGPKYLQINKTGSTYSLWLFFDDADAQVFYITWTSTSDTDSTGQFIMKPSVDSWGGPYGMKVEFSRSALVDSNKIYIGFTNSADNIEGFRIEVTETISGADVSYDVKGMIAMIEQPFSMMLPATEVYNSPSFKMVAVADSTGKGASIQSVVDYVMDFTGITNGTGYKLGTYNHTVSDRAYFLSDGTEEWLYKSVPTATYINTSGTNARQFLENGISNTVLLDNMLSCLEKDPSSPCNGYESLSMNLGTGYFTSTCTDADGADCTAFMQKLYDLGAFNTPPNADALLEPTDSRKTALDAAVHLDSVWPSGKDGNSTFTIPTP